MCYLLHSMYVEYKHRAAAPVEEYFVSKWPRRAASDRHKADTQVFFDERQKPTLSVPALLGPTACIC